MKKNSSIQLWIIPLLAAIALVSCCMLATPQACADLTDGLINYWAFDGDANDSVGGKNGSFPNGTPTSIEGVVGGAFALDGINDYFYVEDFDSSTANQTLSLWIRTNEQEYIGQIGTTFSAPTLELCLHSHNSDENRNKMQVNLWTDGPSFQDYTAYIKDGQWHHIVLALTQTTVEVYTDGVSHWGSPKAIGGNRNILADSDIFLGTINIDSYYIDADFDELGVWNRTLSAGEVASLYNDGSGFNPLSGGGVPEPATVVGLAFMVVAAGWRRMRKVRI